MCVWVWVCVCMCVSLCSHPISLCRDGVWHLTILQQTPRAQWLLSNRITSLFVWSALNWIITDTDTGAHINTHNHTHTTSPLVGLFLAFCSRILPFFSSSSSLHLTQNPLNFIDPAWGFIHTLQQHKGWEVKKKNVKRCLRGNKCYQTRYGGKCGDAILKAINVIYCKNACGI